MITSYIMIKHNTKKYSNSCVLKKNSIEMILGFGSLYYLCVALTGSCVAKYGFRQVMVIVAQLVRAPDCGSGGRGFKSRLSPKKIYKSFGINKIQAFCENFSRQFPDSFFC